MPRSLQSARQRGRVLLISAASRKGGLVVLSTSSLLSILFSTNFRTLSYMRRKPHDVKEMIRLKRWPEVGTTQQSKCGRGRPGVTADLLSPNARRRTRTSAAALPRTGIEVWPFALSATCSGMLLGGRFTNARDAALTQKFAGAVSSHRFAEMEALCLRRSIG